MTSGRPIHRRVKNIEVDDIYKTIIYEVLIVSQ